LHPGLVALTAPSTVRVGATHGTNVAARASADDGNDASASFPQIEFELLHDQLATAA
jgi:hypothetical protein